MTWAPWEVLHNWAPFKIDALGLVTLLGAEEVNSSIGRLVRSAYLEYLPFLGAFVVAGDRFTEKAAGFKLYNISQGIHTTDVSAWLSRWMLSQNFEVTRSFVVWKITPPKSRGQEITVAAIISFVLNGFLIVLTVLSEDWYGFANAVAMIISILVRAYVIGQHRAAIDVMVDAVVRRSETPPTAGSYESEKQEYDVWKKEGKAMMKRDPRPGTDAPTDADASENTARNMVSSKQSRTTQKEKTHPRPVKPNPKDSKFKDSAWIGKSTKVLIILPDSKAVTFWMPNELLVPPSVFIEGPVLSHPLTYVLVRSVGWVVFAVHVVAIGMADLASQLYTVVLLVLPTVLLVLKVGCDDSNWRPTLVGCRRRLMDWCLHRDTNTSDGAEENANSGDFVKQRECWIGSRLKAEIYEWPASYEFTEQETGNDKKWTNGVTKGKERSKKRQDLWAWLALTPEEEESMDKWDLFPHNRDHNKAWWTTYGLKRDCMRSNPNFGPQRLYANNQNGSPELDMEHRYANPRDRKPIAPQSGSSAFPALSDHTVPMLVPEDGGLVNSSL